MHKKQKKINPSEKKKKEVNKKMRRGNDFPRGNEPIIYTTFDF